MVSKKSRSEVRVNKHRKLRNRLSGTAECPRLAVFRSNNHMYAQIIDDTVGNTLVSASTLQKDVKANLEKTNNVDAAAYLGKVIAEKAMTTAYDFIDIGVRQCDAAAAVYQAQISGTKEYGGEYSSIAPLMPAGIRTSTPHLSWTDDVYKDGDTVILELSGNYRHYHCPLARTMILGNASQKVRDLGATVSEGLTAALEGIKPGMLCEDVERIWAKTIAKSGFVKDSRIGYSMGLNFPPDWGEHTASLRPGDKTVLVPGMTFHMIPGIWLDDCGVDTSESFVVTEKGAETFCNFRRELLVK